ncbi:MAG: prephenate dehydrogenase/arogenate dehydrogenase family protein, partial [Paracoccaceae bacterium]
TTGIIGFGAFGQLIANHLAPHTRLMLCDPAHEVMQLANGQSLPNTPITEIARCDFIILAVPVDQIETICRALNPHLRPGTTVIDVGSVKLEPLKIMQTELPDFTPIVATHPLFGPQSAKGGLKNLQIAICPTRGTHHRLIATFVKRRFKLRPIRISAEDHDKEAATVQGITHLIATVLIEMDLPKTRINTASFDLLTQAINMVRDDAPCVLSAIEQANPYAADIRDTFFTTANRIRQRMQPDPSLFGKNTSAGGSRTKNP